MGRTAIILAAATLLTAAPLAAQTRTSDGRIVYDAAFFTQFRPANALQMVERVPGFTLEQTDEEVRGFGQAAGNVVINGERPSAKSDTLETILQRLPANRVARIEVGSGDLFAAEFSGKSQVLNLVLTVTGGLAGTAEGTVRRDFRGKLFPQGNASALLKHGGSTFNAAVTIQNDVTSEEGYDRLFDLPGGTLREYRRKVNVIEEPIVSLTGSWAHDGGANRTAHLNGKIGRDRFALTQSNAVFPTSGTPRDDRLTQRFLLKEYELGGDVTRPLAGGGLKLIGLVTRKRRGNAEISTIGPAPAAPLSSEQFLDSKRDETVARIVWNRGNLWGWSVEAGAEAALNKLDSDTNVFLIDATGTRTRFDLPVDQAVVKEKRGEAFVNAGRSLTPKLRMDLGLTYEHSRLTVTGDAEAARTLRFLKPKATFDWRPDKTWHIVASVQRTVAQLNFEDFIGRAELATDRVNGGNAELLPQRAWEALVTAERPILGSGLVRVELGYNRISLVQDRVPTPEGFDAPGNLGRGEEYILRGKLDAPLGRFGIKGGRLTLSGSYVKSSVRDPYTFEDRLFSGDNLFLFDAEFRQDLGRFAYGITADGNTPATFFRRNELDRNRSEVPFVGVFGEYRPTVQTTLRLGLDNATGVPAFRRRTFFTPDRTDRTPDLREIRKRNQHILPYVTLKHTFG